MRRMLRRNGRCCLADRLAATGIDLVDQPAGAAQGIATEVSRAVIWWAYAHGWDQVETHTKDDNTAARNLVARLGGRIIARETFPDGIERDVFQLPRS